MSFLVWACVHVWLRRARVKAVLRRGKIEVWPGGDSGTAMVETLREAGRLDSLQLLHFHSVRRWRIFAISRQAFVNPRVLCGTAQAGRQYSVLRRRRRLGVDYEGTRSQSDCSVNYGLMNTPTTSSGRLVMRVKKMVCTSDGNHRIGSCGDCASHRAVSNIIGVERNEYTVPTAPAETHRAPCKACGKPGRRCTNRDSPFSA